MKRAVAENDIHWIVRVFKEDAELVSNRERFYSALSLPLTGLYDIKHNISGSESISDTFFRHTLLKWISKEGESATFARLIHVLHNECFRATADSIARNVQNRMSAVRSSIDPTAREIQSQVSLWFDVPPRVIHFTGRAEVLQQLYEVITSQNEQEGTPHFVALSGMGGVGKTAVAVEYAWKYQGINYTNVAWIHADLSSTLRNSFKRLAENCRIPTVDSVGRPIGLDKLAFTIYQKLGPNTLIIFDNVEHYLDVKPVLPTAAPNQETPHVLLTSRLSSGMWSDKFRVIGLDVFDENESLDFFTKYLHLESELETKYARAISKLLHNIPLGIRQAGAFIKMQRDTLGGSNVIHLENYGKQWEKNFKTALNYEHWVQTEDNYENTIYATWNSTFYTIKQQNRLAIRIIQLISYLNPDYIPNDLFYNLKRFEGKFKLLNYILPSGFSEYVENERVDEAIKLLCSYSILTKTEKIRVYKIHRLMQKVIKAQTEEKRSSSSLIEALKLIKTQLLQNYSTNMSDQFYLLHAQSVLAYAKSYRETITIFDLHKLVLQKIEFQLSCQLHQLEIIYVQKGAKATFDMFFEFDKSYLLKGFAQENQIYIRNYFCGFLKFIFNRIIHHSSELSIQKLEIIKNLGKSSLPVFTATMDSLPTEMIEMNLSSNIISSVVSSVLKFIGRVVDLNHDSKCELMRIVLTICKRIVIGKRKYYLVIFTESQNVANVISTLRELDQTEEIQNFLQDIIEMMDNIPDAFIESGFAKSLLDCGVIDKFRPRSSTGNDHRSWPISLKQLKFELPNRKNREKVYHEPPFCIPSRYESVRTPMVPDLTDRYLLQVALRAYYIIHERCLRGINYERVFDCAAEILQCLETLGMHEELYEFIVEFVSDVIEWNSGKLIQAGRENWFRTQAMEFRDKVNQLSQHTKLVRYRDELLHQEKLISKNLLKYN